MAAITSTPQREDITILASVEYNRAASTPYNEVYLAASDSSVRVYLVTYDVVQDRWHCQCKAFEFGATPQTCKHCQRARRRRAVQWHHALRLGVGPHLLRAEQAEKRARVAAEMATEDDLDALDALTLLLQWDHDRERHGEVA